MRKVLPLVGYKSLRALNAYSALLLGLKMIPEYMQESYESFLARVESMPIEDQILVLRRAAEFVELEKDEVEALIGFCTDKNGVPYTKENLSNLNPIEIKEIIVAVCTENSKINTTFLSEDEKKNSEISQLI